MATRQKTTAPRKRSRSKSRKKSPGALRRFLVSFTSTTIVVFGIASCVLNARLPDALRDSSILSRIDWPGAYEPPPAHVDGGDTVTRFTRCPQFFPGGQAPRLPAGEHLRELCFDAFAVLYDAQTRTPLLVVERLNRATLLQARKQHRTDRFYPEARLPRSERAELEDYKGSGYARGHMAPAADMTTPGAMAQSFSLANMVPQDQVHNAGAWSRLEQDTRKYVMRAQGDVFVYTGPLFDGATSHIGHGRVAVPSHLFKLVYDPGSARSWAHIQANRSDTRAGPPLRYAEFVRRTGLQLLAPQGAGSQAQVFGGL
ncbi:DNA/RNA non-specific endonuclease [Herbaspirillum sp. YR522]|uniref:DNA/RNA non-specific endonuclease n=1 Tax=Herbaspirillum sp. YR522 TaxID=1144342 RepID=UPI00026F530F|nr:DNA/RNA non-specific endonuclease [Herbaspirillum sp. YR522]EJN10325.1 DNA/RNA endonuclease G, NUC1 [Herbaspirillum sp. YR522]